MQGREKLRIYDPFPARVRGLDFNRQRFDSDAVLDSLSNDDLSMRIRHRIDPGKPLFIVIWLSRQGQRTAPRIALRGIVRQVAEQADGSFQLLVTFKRHRFLWT